ncbi:T9SS type A sorting domain-containing protein [Chryseobacterium suipulveris]|uniref:T9SS type A sorting domain-containing protein n=1 Tax=Chryseobacterium suipulveris TaxID=2929800 RepID=A0ABY4BYY0_9FLAO|nr:T9SS type A sorting domain-containing protein [Chryseobacterium suipulveris]UOE41725.1 T9SS type A sorting domain-containing protein [Chryseobacterium suipulveris]
MKKIFTILSIAAIASLSAQNLLVNPGFETWTDPAAKPDGWNAMNGGSKETVTVHSGVNSVKLIPVAPNTNANIAAVDVPATENTQYSVGYWVLDNVANSRGRHWIQFRTASANITPGAGGAAFQPSTYTSDAPQWVFVSATATTPATTTILRFDYRVYSQNNIITDPIYFDDVQLVQGALAVTDVNSFDKAIKMNTIVGNELRVILPARATVNIYSAEGRLVSSNRVNSGEAINTSSLAKGNYIVTVSDGSATISRKVMKN